MKAVGLGAAACAVPACAGGSQRVSPDARQRGPNIVLIMADDLGYECLGCYGGISYRTPVLDGLARTGVRFENCHSQPLCTPSRVKLMTGQYNFRNYTDFGILGREQKTFAHLLKEAGYATCVAGKWQLYGSVNQRAEVRGTGALPAQAGFDEHCLWQIDQRGSRYKDPVIVENGKYRTDLAGRYGPDVFCDYIVDFMERQRDRPFLVYYPMVLTHSPFVPTPDSSEWALEKQPAGKKYFADMVAYMDKVVGRIVGGLDELGLRENTLVLFVGDNGTSVGIASRTADGVVRGGKGRTIDAGTHVPLIANWKGVTPGGSVCSDLVDFADFVPTLAELANVRLFGNVGADGRSFLPQLRGLKGDPKQWLFCHYDPRWGNRQASRFVREKRWKLYGDGRLFDVKVDPLEERPVGPGDVGTDAAAARRRLQAVLDSMK